MQVEESELSDDQPQSFTEYRDPKCLLNETKPTFHFSGQSLPSSTEKRLWKNEAPTYRRSARTNRFSDIPVNTRFRRTVVASSDPSSSHFQFVKREITTIEEEVYHYKCSKSYPQYKKGKAYQQKVASLKTVVNRLKQMCLAKPEVTPDKLPEEIMLLFSDIKL